MQDNLLGLFQVIASRRQIQVGKVGPLAAEVTDLVDNFGDDAVDAVELGVPDDRMERPTVRSSLA